MQLAVETKNNYLASMFIFCIKNKDEYDLKRAFLNLLTK